MTELLEIMPFNVVEVFSAIIQNRLRLGYIVGFPFFVSKANGVNIQQPLGSFSLLSFGF
jgi:hypothetical protein